MTTNRFVSVIIPCKAIGPNALECVWHLLNMTYPSFEILLLPDFASDNQLPGVREIPTGAVPPSEKRDLAARLSKGEILAFIDDDAYPRVDWLDNAVLPFEDDTVGAVGGPGVTPELDGLLEQASGAVLSSILGAGPHGYRYIPGHAKDVDDYPSCNLLVRRSTFEAVGGFDTTYWPGEDTILCLAITKGQNQRIVYTPDVVVYHHRRNLFGGHVRQIKSYALHRGFFVKRFPETSMRLNYFIPTLLSLGLLLGFPLSFVPVLGSIYLASVAVYLASVLVSSVLSSRQRVTLLPLVFVGTVMTHVVYGLWFMVGLTANKLEH